MLFNRFPCWFNDFDEEVSISLGIHRNHRPIKSLTFAQQTCESKSFYSMNKQFYPYESSSTPSNHLEQLNNDSNSETIASITTNNHENHPKKKTLARHLFQANIKTSSTRWIRETPV